MEEFGFAVVFQFRKDAFCQSFSKLHAPLIKGIDVPDDALREDIVFIERHEPAERLRRQPLGDNHGGGAIAFEHAMRHERFRLAFRLELLPAVLPKASASACAHACAWSNGVMPRSD